MNILLWLLQAALAWLCIGGGAFQIFKLDELKKNVTAMRELPRALWTALGLFGCIAGVGLIVPGAFNIHPIVTAYAAVGVAAHSALITAFYVRFGDRAPLPYSAAMAIIAAFVAYGRFVLKPF